TKHVVIVDIDGVRRDTFERAYLEGRLPNFERLLGPSANGTGFGSALVFENASMVFPTVTMAAQAPIFTGVYPAVHGISGNAWFDRTTSQRIDYMTPLSKACVYAVSFLFTNCSGGM